jgi:coenzyme PQQ precursor peptide PqqA
MTRSKTPTPKRRAAKPAKTWTKPNVVEIAVGMEINGYACAEL